jgi:hypothetical protein
MSWRCQLYIRWQTRHDRCTMKVFTTSCQSQAAVCAEVICVNTSLETEEKIHPRICWSRAYHSSYVRRVGDLDGLVVGPLSSTTASGAAVLLVRWPSMRAPQIAASTSASHKAWLFLFSLSEIWKANRGVLELARRHCSDVSFWVDPYLSFDDHER